MTLSCLIAPRTKKKMASRSRNNYGCYSYLTSLNVITRQLMIFIVLAAKREQVEVLCVTRPLRWSSGSAWGWLRQTTGYSHQNSALAIC